MKVTETIKYKNGSKIHIAETSKGGNSSWGEKEGYESDSIRLAWYNDDGKFDPYSSSELPLNALKDLLKEAVLRDMYSKADVADMIGCLTASIYRQV